MASIPRLICIHVQRGPRPLMLTRGRDLRFSASLLPERVPDWCKPWPVSRDPFLNPRGNLAVCEQCGAPYDPSVPANLREICQQNEGNR